MLRADNFIQCIHDYAPFYLKTQVKRGYIDCPEVYCYSIFMQITQIPIIFDKSHLLTIGERLYSTSLDLIRELVSNAYDADATHVDIQASPERIIVADNGSGMNEKELQQYLTIGSQEKRMRPLSPKFSRKRIGEFGIGKFSVLTSAAYFSVETQKSEEHFRARLIFDASKWRSDSSNWSIPCELLPYDPTAPSGTKITLTKLKKILEPMHIARHVRERLPIGRDDFKIFVNGNQIVATTIPGKRFPVNFSTPFGYVDGEIILANIPSTQKNISEAGITIRVKNVAITKSLFGFEISHSIGVSKLRGSLNADFLPITSGRDNIIQDSEEYRIFYERTRTCVKEVLNEAKNLAFRKENLQASRLLRDALDKIGRALKKNPEAFKESVIDPPLGEHPFSESGNEEGYVVSQAHFVNSDGHQPYIGTALHAPMQDKKLSKRKHLSLANRAIIRRMRFGNLGIICRMERFGSAYPPSFLEQGIIYINIDHPLYRKQESDDPLLTMFIANLISKELALQKFPVNAQNAFNLQTQILTDAFRDVRRV